MGDLKHTLSLVGIFRQLSNSPDLSFHLLIIFSLSPSAQHYPLASSELSVALQRVVDPSVNRTKYHNSIKGSLERVSQVGTRGR